HITQGLAVLSEVALTKAEQIKLDTKRSKKDFYVSHASSSCDGVNTQSKVPDEQQQKTFGTNEGTDSKDEDENDDDGDNDDDSDNDDDGDSDDQRRKKNINDEETLYDDEDDEVTKKLYKDVNVNLGNVDTEMTNTDQGASDQQNISQESGFEQEEEDAYLLNLENPSPDDYEISSLMETTAQHATIIPEITSSFATTIPPPPLFFNPILQQQTPTFTTTTSTNPIVTLPEIPNFASVFKFDQRVSALESEMSELKQTNQFAKAVSSILGIVDTYLASKMKEAVDVAVQLQTNKLREEAQAENQEFLNQVDSTMKTIIKDQVKAQVSKIMPKIEKYVTESLGAEVLVRSTNQPQTAYAVAASLSEFKLKKILIDKMEANK
ncbi:hypothetical protein Tco_1397815, partial [Tanacetum coccineum]